MCVPHDPRMMTASHVHTRRRRLRPPHFAKDDCGRSRRENNKYRSNDQSNPDVYLSCLWKCARDMCAYEMPSQSGVPKQTYVDAPVFVLDIPSFR